MRPMRPSRTRRRILLDCREAFADKLSTSHAGVDWETDMKRGIIILAALALTAAFNRVSAAEQASQNFFIRVADQVGTYPPRWPGKLRHVLTYRHLYGSYPVACEAVIFPRSPLCVGRPAAFGPYAPYPWNSYIYY